MKKIIFSSLLAAILGTGAYFASQKHPRADLSEIQLANIEALGGEESIICSRPPCGRCYIRSNSGNCVYTGYTDDYCC